MTRSVDCLIIGGGPAGLTAAIYAARFHLSTLVIDSGKSRAALIPCTRNLAGFPDGISGVELLSRMRQHAVKFRAEIHQGHVERLTKTNDGLLARSDDGGIYARTVLLATGVTNRRPPMDDALHAEALRRGRLRYCPVCDGYEVTGQNVAVFGSGAHAMREAEFLRSYSERVTILPPDADDGFTTKQRAQLDAIGIGLVQGPISDFELESEGLSVASPKGRLAFETLYPALGSVVHSDVAAALGATLTETGCIKIDAHQRTSVAGLYAAGDVVIGLDQISHAMGEAGVAATTMRNDLAARSPLLR